MKKFLILFLLAAVVQSNFTAPVQSRLDDILKRKSLLVAVNEGYEPFYIKDPKDGYPGADVEVAELFANYLHIDLKIIPLRGYSEIERAVSSGKVDMAFAGISTDLTRSRDITFSDPYFITTPAGLVNKNVLPPEPEGNIVTTRTFKSLPDLKYLEDISFSVKSSTSNHRYLQNEFGNSTIYPYLNDKFALDALYKNQVSCFVGDGLFILALLQKTPGLKANYSPLLDPVQEEHISALLPKDDLLFLQRVNFFIKELRRTGTIANLRNRYFGSNQWVKTE